MQIHCNVERQYSISCFQLAAIQLQYPTSHSLLLTVVFFPFARIFSFGVDGVDDVEFLVACDGGRDTVCDDCDENSPAPYPN